jgi:hypothetical protein
LEKTLYNIYLENEGVYIDIILGMGVFLCSFEEEKAFLQKRKEQKGIRKGRRRR